MFLDWGLRRSAQCWPDKVALIEGEWRVSYREFAARVDRLANAFGALGIAPGDRVALLMANSARYTELYYAASVAGVVVVPLNTRLAVPELAAILDDAGATALFATREFVGPARELAARCPALARLVLAEAEDAPDGFLAYEALLAAAPVGYPARAASEDDLVGLFYTGGTTGLPKGVLLSQRNLVANAQHILMTIPLREDDLYLHVAPMFHLADLGATFAVTCAGVPMPTCAPSRRRRCWTRSRASGSPSSPWCPQ